MAKVFLSLGSNIQRQKNINAGLDALALQFGKLQLSRVFESEAVGFNGANFYNLVAAIHTEISPGMLARQLREIEEANGRLRHDTKFSARTLDIDILAYSDLVGTIEGVSLPRDEIEKNAFVLWPLAELAPQTLHPRSKLSFAQLWAEYDKSKQKLWAIPFSYS